LSDAKPPGSASDGPPASGRPLIFISAAEQSADLHGAALIRATRQLRPSARFVGVAGPRMVAEGCWPIFDMTRHAAMLLGVFGAAGRAVAMLSSAAAHLRRYAFDAAVVIDSPTLHLPLAGRAQAAGIPVMYYIAPQMWAWGAYRIHKLRNRVDRLAVILPFEEQYFRDQGVDARYVGHPLMDQLRAVEVDSAAVDAVRNGAYRFVALLPGSREHVVREVLGGQLEIAERIVKAVPGVRFGVSVANDHVAPVVAAALAKCRVPINTCAGGHAALIRAADLVLVASGTTTLEVAYHQRPMIVMYNASPWFYRLIGRWMIHTPHLSLPNILAGHEIVPEFMPYYRSTEPIARRAIALLQSDDMRRRMVRELGTMIESLKTGNASKHAAKMLLDMVARNAPKH
jgi:lipid-A-disaccharide synthase